MGFEPYNRALKIRESIWESNFEHGSSLRSVRVHSLTLFALLGACDVTPRSFSWPATLKPLVLVTSPRLRLRQASPLVIIIGATMTNLSPKMMFGFLVTWCLALKSKTQRLFSSFLFDELSKTSRFWKKQSLWSVSLRTYTLLVSTRWVSITSSTSIVLNLEWESSYFRCSFSIKLTWDFLLLLDRVNPLNFSSRFFICSIIFLSSHSFS